MMQYLKKHVRAHKFLDLMTWEEIESILKIHELKIKKFPEINLKDYPEVRDEYDEMINGIIISAREELKMKFLQKYKLKFKKNYNEEFHVKEFLKSI